LDFLIFRDEAPITAAPLVICRQIFLKEAGIAIQDCLSALLMKSLDLLLDGPAAVIGGLLLATFGTLTFVPVFFSLMHRNDLPLAQRTVEGDPYEA